MVRFSRQYSIIVSRDLRWECVDSRVIGLSREDSERSEVCVCGNVYVLDICVRQCST